MGVAARVARKPLYLLGFSVKGHLGVNEML
jgi:hypothetical protein